MFKPGSYQTTLGPSAKPFLSWVPETVRGPMTYREKMLFPYGFEGPSTANYHNASMGEPKSWHESFIKAYNKCEILGCTVAVTDHRSRGLNSKKFELFADCPRTYNMFETQFEKYIREESLIEEDSSEQSETSSLDLIKKKLFKTHISDTLKSLSAHLDDKPVDDDNIRWISLIGLEPKAIKLLVNKLQLNELAVDYLLDFTSDKSGTFSFDNQLLINMPCMALYRNPEPEYTVRKTWLHGEKLSGKERPGVCDKLMESEDKTYTLSDALRERPKKSFPSKYLAYADHATDYKEELSKLEAKSPLYSKGYIINSGKIGVLWINKNTVLTYSTLLGDVSETYLMKQLSHPMNSSMFKEPAHLVYTMVSRNTQELKKMMIAFDELVTKLTVDITRNPSIENSKQLYALVGELSSVRSSSELFLSTLKGLNTNPKAVSWINQNSKALFESLDIQAEITMNRINNMINECENLTNLTFNHLSYLTNDSMSKLTLVTMIFLPLSFWCGYYGMNFSPFAAVDDNGVGYFWYMALPFTVGFMLILRANMLIKLSKDIAEHEDVAAVYLRLQTGVKYGMKNKIKEMIKFPSISTKKVNSGPLTA